MVIELSGRHTRALWHVTRGACRQYRATLAGMTGTAEAAAVTVRSGLVTVGCRDGLSIAMIMMSGTGRSLRVVVRHAIRHGGWCAVAIGMQRLPRVRLKDRRQGQHKDQNPVRQSHGRVL